MEMPILPSSSTAICFAFPVSMILSGPTPNFVGSEPSQKFRHTDMSGTMARSW